MIQYCKRCCLPSTKPHLAFDEEGICNACRNYENRKNVDWDERKKELMAILDRYRSKDGSNWDCIIPVSGGKDSTYQVVTMLELGMNPLCVTATTCDLTDIGRRNIENIKKMGVDYIEVTTNRIVRAKLNRIGLLEVGDISWPEHVSIFTVPVRMAVNFNIPLIIWGENSQNEYGGPAAAVENNVLDRRWLEEFGGMLGLRVNDLVGQEGITKKDLIPFTYPSDEELKRVGVTGIFLGYYIPWEGLHNVLVAKAHGFESWGKVVEGDYDDYENLDNYQEHNVKWWDAVDVISSSGYYPLEDWENQLDRIEAVVKKFQKPFFFAEAGCMSIVDSNKVPNDWTVQGEADVKGQADWYEAMFEACLKREWVRGMAFWSWNSHLYTKNTALKRKDYEIYAKPAEKIVKKYYDSIQK